MEADQKAMNINAAVAAELRAERGAARLTIDGLAEKSGVPRRTLVRLLNGERDINVGVLAALAGALGTTPQDIFVRAQDRLYRDSPEPPPATDGDRTLVAPGTPAMRRSGNRTQSSRRAHGRSPADAPGDADTQSVGTE